MHDVRINYTFDDPLIKWIHSHNHPAHQTFDLRKPIALHVRFLSWIKFWFATEKKDFVFGIAKNACKVMLYVLSNHKRFVSICTRKLLKTNKHCCTTTVLVSMKMNIRNDKAFHQWRSKLLDGFLLPCCTNYCPCLRKFVVRLALTLIYCQLSNAVSLLMNCIVISESKRFDNLAATVRVLIELTPAVSPFLDKIAALKHTQKIISHSHSQKKQQQQTKYLSI